VTLGSLFDGSGTAPLAASMCGITPVWASEINKYCVAVTSARFPEMVHLGDVTEIDGAKIPAVDIICGGSPCQDLSAAGKREGLDDGKQSSLFYHMARIISEMRKATGKPRFVVWENVPGAFSSNGGRDFLSVIKEFAQIADPDVHVPEPERNRGGRLAWRYAGEVGGRGWSIAWRTMDAQYWGVPQRRRRIFLVCDFGSERAGQILFEREGLPGHLEPGGETGKAAAESAERGAGAAGFSPKAGSKAKGIAWEREKSPTLMAGVRAGVCHGAYAMRIRAGCEGGGKGPLIQNDVSGTLTGNNDQTIFDPVILENHPADSRVKIREDGTVQTLSSFMGTGGNNVPLVMAHGQANAEMLTDKCPTLSCNHEAPILARKEKVFNEARFGGWKTGFGCLKAQGNPPHCVVSPDEKRNWIVRRLTPRECGRLQGFPDWWCDGVEISDTQQYMMWGNGMALPCVEHVMRGIVKLTEKEGGTA
jgi:DNA (cytosine-5)-methyltransferase 1